MATHSLPHESCCTLYRITAVTALEKMFMQATQQLSLLLMQCVGVLQVAAAVNILLTASATSNDAITAGDACFQRVLSVVVAS